MNSDICIGDSFISIRDSDSIETCVMSHQSLSRQAKTKTESPTSVEFGSRTPKSDHGSSENV